MFAETTDDWRKSRKAILPAFYKGKLESMVEVAKQAARTTLTRYKTIYSTSGQSLVKVDIMNEIGLMTSRILLLCALGVDCADYPVDFWENGVRVSKPVVYSMR